MDFADTPDEAAFRTRARAFLDAEMPPRGEDSRAYRSRELGPNDVIASKAWQARKAAAGFTGILWPKAYGGGEGTPMQQIIFDQEEARYLVPPGIFNQGVGMAMPTLMEHGTSAQLSRFPGPALRGDEVWCQLFSEPGAGSDLAGLRTRAVLEGDAWRINGQKIWTSNAHFADFGMLVARSRFDVPKHEGLTFFILDMRAPGVTVRRIRQISGTSNFCEVFLTDVLIPDAMRVGKVGGGWNVSMTMLMNERFVVGQTEKPDFDEIFALAQQLTLDEKPALESDVVQDRLASWYVQAQGLKYTRLRTQTALSRGKTPGPEASIAKLVSATKLQQIAAFGIDLLGMAGGVMDPDLAPMNALFQEAFLFAPSKRIAGGTDEILRNIIAERVLKLPPDIRADKGKNFNEIPSSGR